MEYIYYLISPEEYEKIKGMPNFEKLYKLTYKQYLINNITELKHRPNVIYLINRTKNPKEALQVLEKFKINYSHKYL